ncbi:MAG: hypothetical protein Tp1102DCM384591_24 [Prokaryotic dsDNA virus sp.]|nr:MAG: hypothetical protein Tp1102DCM384591_24 [Prokaryotic dsDNA virus sp.]|tara:strand:+ start:8666 stop:8797 length:132 start_codon:yes stop_codon:yes gene_type:complete
MHQIIGDLEIVLEAIENGDNDDAAYMLKEIKQELEYKAIIYGW